VTHIWLEVDFKTKLVRRDKEDHFILIKRTINHKNISIVSMYAPEVGAPNFTKKILQVIEA
jgi:hypothetical protein